jgi:hypothetical protein
MRFPGSKLSFHAGNFGFRWLEDASPLRIWEKSRQVGATKTDAFDSVMKASPLHPLLRRRRRLIQLRFTPYILRITHHASPVTPIFPLD